MSSKSPEANAPKVTRAIIKQSHQSKNFQLSKNFPKDYCCSCANSGNTLGFSISMFSMYEKILIQFLCTGQYFPYIVKWARASLGSCLLLLPKINAAAKQCPLKDIPLGNIMAKLRKKPDANLKKRLPSLAYH